MHLYIPDDTLLLYVLLIGPLTNGGSNDHTPELIAGLVTLKTNNKHNKPKKNLTAQSQNKVDNNSDVLLPPGALLSSKPKQVDNHHADRNCHYCM